MMSEGLKQDIRVVQLSHGDSLDSGILHFSTQPYRLIPSWNTEHKNLRTFRDEGFIVGLPIVKPEWQVPLERDGVRMRNRGENEVAFSHQDSGCTTRQYKSLLSCDRIRMRVGAREIQEVTPIGCNHPYFFPPSARPAS